MTTTDYFLATPVELAQACRGWVEAGSTASPDASPNAEYFNLTWADLKSVDMLVLGPLAAILLKSDLDVAEKHMAPSLEGRGDEQALFVLSDQFVQCLAGLADAQLPDVVATWLVPLRDAEVDPSRSEHGERRAFIEGFRAGTYRAVSRTRGDAARWCVDVAMQHSATGG